MGHWQWGTGGMGHMGNEYRRYGPHEQWGIWHNKVQGVWATWAMGTHGAVGYRGMWYSEYQSHGQWRHIGQ